ncbi:MAG: ornithine cyclodeaminase family protein [candidate division KSB1 bacterium]|nr:ornithine cyclodeaminase family protein [candidate division KSB1 bacterium]MDZ7364251.1 ornithine cyclodeaminase family protein [candidate division KSB1 bacterium]MDZ7404974.1 ornithine cyclodeaminase family protein [candidate division KSB1 bacterium]
MKVLIVNQSEVAEWLPMHECIEVMAEAFKMLAAGKTILPLRPIMWLPERFGALGMMPAYMQDLNAMGLKVLTIFPGNHGTSYDSHQGAVLLFEAKHGCLLAIMDATEITAIRTAAVSGLATKLLAREDAGDLAILGAGTQARTHLEAMRLARKITRVRVWSRNADHAKKFAARESQRFNINIETRPTAKEAVIGADIICTTTAAAEPVVSGEWLKAGAHLNAVGAFTPLTRELDTAAMLKSRLFVDRRESALNEAGDFIIPKTEGALDDSHIRGEIGEILLGQIAGRTSPDEITLFKSLGLAIEDLASAQHIYTKMLEKGAGTWVELGGSRRETD